MDLYNYIDKNISIDFWMNGTEYTNYSGKLISINLDDMASYIEIENGGITQILLVSLTVAVSKIKNETGAIIFCNNKVVNGYGRTYNCEITSMALREVSDLLNNNGNLVR